MEPTDSATTVATDPLIEAFEAAVTTAERGRYEDDIAAVSPLRTRLSAVLAAARAVERERPLVLACAGLDRSLDALRDALTAADAEVAR